MFILFAVLGAAFPRIAIVLLWLFTNFFRGVYDGVIIPVLGFLFLPLTLLVYTYIDKTYGHHMSTVQLVCIFIAVIVDLGLVGGGGRLRQRSA
ncbi:MAG TPA: hypothetical protein VK604_04900 [Bryobacteraceae bacterium]|nr:hypothetical protein [Bryobacteraceae bacterium]